MPAAGRGEHDSYMQKAVEEIEQLIRGMTHRGDEERRRGVAGVKARQTAYERRKRRSTMRQEGQGRRRNGGI